MKRILFVAVLVVAMVAAMTGVAFAGSTMGVAGISQWVAGDTVHSGYATTTNACKVCHDVHGNANYKLFIDNNVSNGCSTCHVIATAAPNVYTGATDAHVLNVAAVVIPDSTNAAGMLGTDNVLGCLDCHDAAPHGAGHTAAIYALTKDVTAGATAEDFCLRCHDNNDGRLTAGVRADNTTHVMAPLAAVYTEFGAATTTHADAGATSATCRSCHVEPLAAGGGDFPHSGVYKLLTAGSAAQALDAECRLCHGTTVGVAY